MSKIYSHIHLYPGDECRKEELISESGKYITVKIGDATLFFTNNAFEEFKKMINEPFEKEDENE